MEVSFWQLGGVSSWTFVACIGLSNCFTSSPPPLFEWCLSFRGPIFFFSLESSSSSSKFKLRVSKGVCSCCKNYHPFCPNFSLFKYHCLFTSFSSSKFIFAMLKFFDRIVAKSGFGFFLNIFKLRFIHLINYLVNDPLGKILNTFKIYLTQKTWLTTYPNYSKYVFMLFQSISPKI